jgi:putative photosynthetic complex assembly protein
MNVRIGSVPPPPAGGGDALPPPPPRGRRSNGAARRLTAEVTEGGSGGASPPRPLLMAAAAVAILAIALAAGARLTGAGHIPPPAGVVAEQRDLRFEDASDGSVLVRAVGDGGTVRDVAVLRPGQLMFVRSTLRALVRERRLGGRVDQDAPFRVTRYRDGRLTLDDPATAQHLELAAYGPANAAAFGQLLDAARDPVTAARD